jgi:hypothetical protein
MAKLAWLRVGRQRNRCSVLHRDKGFFLYSSRQALGDTTPPIQEVAGLLTPGVKTPEREVDYSPSSSAECKNAWRYTYTSPNVFTAWCLIKLKENVVILTFYK